MKPARKPKLTAVLNRPVVLDMDVDENPVIQRAREKFGDGKPRQFVHEPGSTFRWRSGPTVLTEWLRRRHAERQA